MNNVPDILQPQRDSILQLIDETKHFDLSGFSEHLDKTWKMHHLGTSYRVISVLGSQSSGKSTLLNAVFDTDFGIMMEGSRSQTTKGIWLSNTSNSGNMLVMDVEGTDGRERGENQDFERKSALFSLALSEVLIINMWEHSIGLYNGANMALLRTVFEVNLELFGRSATSKTLLLFVIRDFIGVTPLESLAETLLKDLHGVWKKLGKPSGLEDSVLEDFFDLQFVALHHKILRASEFEQGIDALKERFFNQNSEAYFFPASKYQKSVPIDGLPIYAKGIWEQIVHNKDLDLPTQQQLLSQFRCDEIGRELLVRFRDAISQYNKYSQGIMPEVGFLDELLQVKQAYLSEFNEKSHRYHPEIVQEKTNELESVFDDLLCKLLYGIGRMFLKDAIPLFTKEFAANKRAKMSFKDCILRAESETKQRLTANIDSITTGKVGNLSFSFIWDEFEALLGQEKKTFVDENSRKLIESHRAECDKLVHETISTCIQTFFMQPANESEKNENPWLSFFAAISSAIDEAQEGLRGKLIHDLCGKERGIELSNEFIAERWKSTLQEIASFFEVANVTHELVGLFEKGFRYDKKTEMPRVWTPSDNIDQIYTEVLEKLLVAVDNFSPYESRIPLQFVGGSIVENTSLLDNIITDAKVKSIRSRFTKQCESLFLETKRSLLQTKTKIPVWVLVLLVYLGWREILTVVRNPFYLIFLIIIGSTMFVIYSLNLQKPMEYFLSHTLRTMLKASMSSLNAETQPVAINGNTNNAME